MKIFVILALARYFHLLHSNEVDKTFNLIIPLFLIIIPTAIILKQPNLGTATILFASGIAVFFATGISWKKFAIAGIIAMLVIPVGYNFLHDYQKRRVTTFLNPESDPLGAGYNIIQSKIAIGSGGFSGKGFMEGSQGQLNFLPEKETDFIFTMIAEEFGFLGGATIIILYMLIIFFGIKIAADSSNHFGRMVSSGITAILFFHVFINTAMVMGMIPVVGVPLPLLSYGGSIMVTMLISFGFILNAYIHRDINLFRGG